MQPFKESSAAAFDVANGGGGGEKLHPSWEAKRKAKEAATAAASAATKKVHIKFDDD
jgi:hypothetical protein